VCVCVLCAYNLLHNMTALHITQINGPQVGHLCFNGRKDSDHTIWPSTLASFLGDFGFKYWSEDQLCCMRLVSFSSNSLAQCRGTA
jgi:hypothetical protein